MKSASMPIPSPTGRSPLGTLQDGGTRVPLPDMETCRKFLLGFSREISVPRGTKLMIGNVFYLLEGAVSLTAVSATGERHSLVYFEPGDLLSFIPSVNHVYSIPHEAFDFLLYNESLAMFAQTPCRLVCTDHRQFMRHMDEEPIKTLLIRGLASNLLKVIVQSVNNCTLSATVRVCRMLSVFMQKEEPHAIPRYLTHTEIAGHLSLHVMTVTKIFHSLRREGILGRIHGVTLVKDPARLMSLASQKSLLSYKNAGAESPRT
ncbi:Crp/Fnr family transcriptional regulator [Mailhella massiliensis]|uniref:Crp/Fnr family transcriptional regulator n=1 Tax=Mailhella massiliensis TaxID=1903261 RepID=A0A921DR51_9BACT|nr:Crp/Fnr family transcriptional regulator [Mailhella massiliensis]HJD97264.1 Crp/Fnr family transcriptional regulator [Mailhella massiliensis]